MANKLQIATCLYTLPLLLFGAESRFFVRFSQKATNKMDLGTELEALGTIFSQLDWIGLSCQNAEQHTILQQAVEEICKNATSIFSKQEKYELFFSILAIDNTQNFRKIGLANRNLYAGLCTLQAIEIASQETSTLDMYKYGIAQLDNALWMVPVRALSNLITQLVGKIHERAVQLFGAPKCQARTTSVEPYPYSIVLPTHASYAKAIQRHANLTREQLAPFVESLTPVIMNCAIQWPAFDKWKNLDYLAQHAAYRLVPVEQGSSYIDPNFYRKMTPFASFLQDTIVNQKQGYLAQHHLFNQVPSLMQDFSVPDLMLTMQCRRICGWFGPNHTVSPLHVDSQDNLFVQAVGRKYIRLYRPQDEDYMYRNFDKPIIVSHVQNVFLQAAEYDLLEKVDYWECILGPGEMLYLPRGWWHYVESLDDVTFSVNFWYA